MSKWNVRSLGRVVAGLVVACGLTLSSGCSNCCKKSDGCCKQSAKCGSDCTQKCCKQASAKGCPEGCAKDCCKKT